MQSVSYETQTSLYWIKHIYSLTVRCTRQLLKKCKYVNYSYLLNNIYGHPWTMSRDNVRWLWNMILFSRQTKNNRRKWAMRCYKRLCQLQILLVLTKSSFAWSSVVKLQSRLNCVQLHTESIMGLLT